VAAFDFVAVGSGFAVVGSVSQAEVFGCHYQAVQRLAAVHSGHLFGCV